MLFNIRQHDPIQLTWLYLLAHLIGRFVPFLQPEMDLACFKMKVRLLSKTIASVTRRKN